MIQSLICSKIDVVCSAGGLERQEQFKLEWTKIKMHLSLHGLPSLTL